MCFLYMYMYIYIYIQIALLGRLGWVEEFGKASTCDHIKKAGLEMDQFTGHMKDCRYIYIYIYTYVYTYMYNIFNIIYIYIYVRIYMNRLMVMDQFLPEIAGDMKTCT